MESRRLVLVGGGALVGTLLLASAGYGQEPRKISIGLSSPSIANSQPKIAQQLALFSKNGLAPNIIQMDSSSVAAAALISGSLDFAVINPTDAVLAQSHGQSLVIVRSLYTGFPAVVVLSKAAAEKAGVSASASVSQRLKALDGLLISTSSPTAAYTISIKGATEAENARLRFTYMALPAAAAALSTGAIDAYVGTAPFYGMSVLNGSGVVWINGPQGEIPAKFSLSNSVGLITTKKFAEANPDVIKRINTVFDEFAKMTVEQPPAIKDALTKLYPDVDGKNLDIILAAELPSFNGRRLTREDVAPIIRFVKLMDASIPEGMDPSALVIP